MVGFLFRNVISNANYYAPILFFVLFLFVFVVLFFAYFPKFLLILKNVIVFGLLRHQMRYVWNTKCIIRIRGNYFFYFLVYYNIRLDAAATLGPMVSGASIDWLDGGHLAPVFVEAGGLRLGEEALVDGVADAIARALDSSAVGLLQ